MDSIRGKKMRKELGQVPQFVGLKTMDRGVLFSEDLLPDLTKSMIETAETFSKISIEGHVATFLSAAGHDHVADFIFLTFSDSLLDKKVSTFFETETGHDGEIDLLPEDDEFMLSFVDDLGSILGVFLKNRSSSGTLFTNTTVVAITGRIIIITITVTASFTSIIISITVFIAVLTEDLASELSVTLLVLEVIRVDAEVVEVVMGLERRVIE